MNPLITPSKLKNAAVAFDQIRPEHFEPALDEAIRRGREILAALKSKPASFENTVRGLELATEESDFAFIVFQNLLIANSNEQLQELSAGLGAKLAAFSNDILLDHDIFTRLQEVHQSRHQSALNPEQIRLVEKLYRDFQQNGAGLDGQKKQRLREIDGKLAALGPKFHENLLKATNSFEMWVEDENELDGLPEAQRDAAREAAKAKGRDAWLFTVHAPSYTPFMAHAKNRALREKMYRASASRGFGGPYDNQAHILEIAQLMQEKARLLGEPTYAQHALKMCMAETPERVMDFLNRLLEVSKPAALKEMAEVQAFADEMGGPRPLQGWDFLFYAERLKEKKYAFDEEELRPYFKLENVLNGVFEHAHRLFGLTFQPSSEYPVYHPEVQVFEVFKDTPDKRFIGLFYADFFPRESKGQGAWMTNFYEQGHFRGKKIRPHVSIVCNFPRPTSQRPSLLNFRDVQTLFHEFGHALHGLLSHVEYRTLAGTNVYRDFLELPSQILENWTKQEQSLKLFAHHYQTGEVIPMDLLNKLKRSQQFLAGYLSMRQLNFAFLDMAWYTNPPPLGGSVDDFEDKATARTRLLPKVEGTNISCSFGHIFAGGYASGYYGYKWAEALDADAFELFEEKGIFDRNTASRFEEFILSKGGSEHPMVLYQNFRGRAPDPDALLRRNGLI